jgi:hypothetical protein
MNINTTSQPGLTQASTPVQHPATTGRTIGTPHPFSTLLRNVHGPLNHSVNSHMQTQVNSLNAHAFANRAP